MVPHSQLVHQLSVLSGKGYAVQTAETCQDGLHFPGCKQGLIHPVPFHDGNASVHTPGGHNGDSCLAYILNVAVDGAPGYLKFIRKIGRGHLLFLEKDG